MIAYMSRRVSRGVGIGVFLAAAAWGAGAAAGTSPGSRPADRYVPFPCEIADLVEAYSAGDGIPLALSATRYLSEGPYAGFAELVYSDPGGSDVPRSEIITREGKVYVFTRVVDEETAGLMFPGTQWRGLAVFNLAVLATLRKVEGGSALREMGATMSRVHLALASNEVKRVLEEGRVSAEYSIQGTVITVRRCDARIAVDFVDEGTHRIIRKAFRDQEVERVGGLRPGAK